MATPRKKKPAKKPKDYSNAPPKVQRKKLNKSLQEHEVRWETARDSITECQIELKRCSNMGEIYMDLRDALLSVLPKELIDNCDNTVRTMAKDITDASKSLDDTMKAYVKLGSPTGKVDSNDKEQQRNYMELIEIPQVVINECMPAILFNALSLTQVTDEALKEKGTQLGLDRNAIIQAAQIIRNTPTDPDGTTPVSSFEEIYQNILNKIPELQEDEAVVITTGSTINEQGEIESVGDEVIVVYKDSDTDKIIASNDDNIVHDATAQEVTQENEEAKDE